MRGTQQRDCLPGPAHVKRRELMIDHEVGVSARTVKVPKLDSDYFDEEST
jgi:hypothetical protein